MLKYIAYLAAAGKVDLASVMFSRVGHTHCALGALTAVLHSWVGTVLVSIGQFAKTVPSSEIKFSDCWQQQCDIVTSFVMSKTSSSPLTFILKIWTSFQFFLHENPLAEFRLAVYVAPRKVLYMLHRIGIRSWIGPHCQIRVEYIDSVRDWKKWLLVCKGHYFQFQISFWIFLTWLSKVRKCAGDFLRWIERWQHWLALFHCCAQAQKLEQH